MKKAKTLQDMIDYADLVRKKYRTSLLAIGKSPDTHIYDLSLEGIKGRSNPKERLFLVKVLRFYDGLFPKDQDIFVAEVLERYRHYPYWYFENYRDSDFAKRKDNVLKKVSYVL